ncbi:preprotein translocase subunit SecY [Candidatus Pacearchaeota archaeon]|nr:preprotein translocase subunit SecY [Candidatus Pacearchaeota archaeon]
MSMWKGLLMNLPEVEGPTQKLLSFKEKLKWTGVILIIYYILGMLPLFGLDPQSQFRFEQLEIILAAKFGSLISLGIGPIVTASIVLQLLNGSGILKFDLTTPEGKRTFQGVQKLLAIFFIIFEAIIYVFMGGLNPPQQFVGIAFYTQLRYLLVFQLILGGIMILFMDEVISKWGFGSGISLFIVAGVSQQIFIQTFNWIIPEGSTYSIGAVWALFQALSAGDPTEAGIRFSALLATVLVFFIAVYAQAMKVEIPLSFGRIRGHGIRWPLSFLYTSNIPVILVAALMANMQLWGRFMQNWGFPLLGRFSETTNQPISGLVYLLQSPNVVRGAITGSIGWGEIGQAFVYLLFMMLGAVVFSMFWVQTAGMDARSQAKNMMSSGLQIPGFRKDERILERILNRYIWPLTVMGGLAVGLLAGIADLTGALSRGTGILLSVMIVYKLYEEIAQQHMMDMNPMLRRFMGS